MWKGWREFSSVPMGMRALTFITTQGCQGGGLLKSSEGKALLTLSRILRHLAFTLRVMGTKGRNSSSLLSFLLSFLLFSP